MQTESKRKLVHISMAAFALAVGRLPSWAIVLCCLAALTLNAFVLPRFTRRALERDTDLSRGFALGIVMYPAVLLLLAVVFYQAQVFVVIAWAAMAFGDGFAGLLGSRYGGTRLPWSSHKSWTGLLAFWLFGGCLSMLWLALLPQHALLGLTLASWAPIIALGILVAGFLETLEGFIDDNFIVPVSAAATSYLAYAYVTHANVNQSLPSNWQLGLGLVLGLSITAIALRKITIAGGLLGGLIAWLIFLGGGLASLSLLLYFFLVGTFASKWRYRQKLALGLAQENKAIRGVRNAAANGGVAAILGLCNFLFYDADLLGLFNIMLAASLISAVSDTLSSEMGNLYGKRYVNILNFKPDQRGRDGAISLEGSLFGAAGALVGALIFLAWALVNPDVRTFGYYAVVAVLFLAGCFGNLIDSALGATLQRRGYMNNDTVNFFSTMAACIFALIVILVASVLLFDSHTLTV